MCDSWKKQHTIDELSVDDYSRIFSQLPQLDFVRLSGGEPFLRPDLLEITELIHQHLDPLVLHITTNGLKTRQILRFCEQRKRNRPLELLLSLDGVDEKHDEIRGRRDAFRRAFETLKALASRQSELNVHITVNQTAIDDDSYEQYHRLRRRLAPLGIKNHLVIAYDGSATYTDDDANHAPTVAGELSRYRDLTQSVGARLIRDSLEQTADYPPPERAAKRYALFGALNRLVLNRPSPNPPCAALGAHMRILPDGSVPTCQFNSTTIGDLRSDRFHDVWTGEQKQKQRRWVRDCPGCWAECEILPSAFYSGDIFFHALRELFTSSKVDQAAFSACFEV